MGRLNQGAMATSRGFRYLRYTFAEHIFSGTLSQPILRSFGEPIMSSRFSLLLLLAVAGCGAGTGTAPCSSCGGGAPPNFLEVLYAFPSNTIFSSSLSATINLNTGGFGSTSYGSSPVLISSGMVAANAQFLYISRSLGAQIFGYSIDQTNGALTPLSGSPFSFGTNLSFFGLVATPNGQFLYVPDANQIDALSVDSTTGVPSIIPGSPFAAAGNEQLVVDPSGEFVYASDGNPPGGILAFAVGPTGALTPVPGSPFVIPNQSVSNSEPYGIVDTGKFVYAALFGSSEIAAFSIDSSTGALTPVPGSPFPSDEALPTILTFTGNFLYVINATDGSISGYAINPASGALTPIPGSPFGSENTYFVIDASGEYMYVSSGSTILSWNINPTTGALTQGVEDYSYDGDGSLWLTVVRLPLPTTQ